MNISHKRELQQIVSNHLSDIDFKNLMKLYKDYTKEPYSFLVNDATLSSDNKYHYDLEITYYKNKKIKTIDNKIEQNKAQYDLDKQTTKISALSSGNISKYESLTGKDLLEKAAALKRFGNSLSGKELKPQTDIAKKQYQELDKAFISNKDNKNVNESLTKKKRKNIISQI